MNEIKSFFNLYCNNIDEPLTRLYYWAFTLEVVGLILILRLVQINLELDLENTIIVLDLIFMVPTIVVTVKRLNDIFGNSDYMTVFIIISTILAFMPDWSNIDLWSWLIIGLLPSNYISNLKESYYVYKKVF
jgi:uncharacterized membrane protein YhaH (DUF805 family)